MTFRDMLDWLTDRLASGRHDGLRFGAQGLVVVFGTVSLHLVLRTFTASLYIDVETLSDYDGSVESATGLQPVKLSLLEAWRLRRWYTRTRREHERANRIEFARILTSITQD
jgi:hypothetical protein